MNTTLAFDIYGTLIDTDGVIHKLAETLGDKAPNFSALWRNKQLEYTFRRSLMGKYVDFSVCTRQALDWTCEATGAHLPEKTRQDLITMYKTLPAFSDVADSLHKLSGEGFRMFAFSNGTAAGIREILENAGILQYFADIVSVEPLKIFKPSPLVYEYFLTQTKSNRDRTWLISSNPFDVIGAVSVGIKSVWNRRSRSVPFDPWEFEPTAVINSLNELPDALG